MATNATLKLGDPAPPFALPDSYGVEHRLKDVSGRLVVLYFFPRADTPGCTTQAQDFSGLEGEFAATGAVIIGISADPPRKLARFRVKRDISVLLLSDETGAALNAYGVWGEKTMYGKTFEGILRTTFLIGKDGRIAEIWRAVKVPGHASAVLEAARERA